MKQIILISIALISINSFGQNNKIKTSDLFGCWTDSREENDRNSDVMIYRPEDFKEFPVSRFRFRMDLKEDNVCSWLYLSPNDGHHMKDGTWAFNKKTMTLDILDAKKEKVKSFEISEIGKDILKIKRLNL